MLNVLFTRPAGPPNREESPGAIRAPDIFVYQRGTYIRYIGRQEAVVSSSRNGENRTLKVGLSFGEAEASEDEKLAGSVLEKEHGLSIRIPGLTNKMKEIMVMGGWKFPVFFETLRLKITC